MRFGWKPEKNEKLKAERGISFEDVEQALAAGGLRAMLPYVGDRQIHRDHIILVVDIDGEFWAVPVAVTEALVFFRTAYPIDWEEV